LRDSCDERQGQVTGGTRPGANGRQSPALLAVAAIAAAICTVNALSILDEAGRSGEALTPWKPWTTEYTSLAGLLTALPIAVAAERHSVAGGRLGRGAAVILFGSVLFSAVHVAVMVALRHLVWWVEGEVYSFDLGRDWLYEYRKDLLGYVFALIALSVARRWPEAPSAPPGRSSDPRAVLRDGRREVEIDCTALLAVRGGGNYIELLFANAPRRLLRSTLAAAETALRPHGFGKSHKSWLVKLDCVEGVERTPSGDYRLRLADGVEAPLSRRAGGLLAELKGRSGRS
jgi:hypothetical protein